MTLGNPKYDLLSWEAHQTVSPSQALIGREKNVLLACGKPILVLSHLKFLLDCIENCVFTIEFLHSLKDYNGFVLFGVLF